MTTQYTTETADSPSVTYKNSRNKGGKVTAVSLYLSFFVDKHFSHRNSH